MKKIFDLRKRVGSLIQVIESIPEKHRTPAAVRLLADLKMACKEFDGEQA